MTTREWEGGLQIRSDQGLVPLGNAHPQHDGRGSQGHQAQESSGTYNNILSSWMSAATRPTGPTPSVSSQEPDKCWYLWPCSAIKELPEFTMMGFNSIRVGIELAFRGMRFTRDLKRLDGRVTRPWPCFESSSSDFRCNGRSGDLLKECTRPVSCT